MRNPQLLNALDNLLKDYLPPKQRRLVHSVLTLAIALGAIYLAANGDWEQFAVAVIAALYAGANRANTTPPPPPETEEEISGVVEGAPLESPEEYQEGPVEP